MVVIVVVVTVKWCCCYKHFHSVIFVYFLILNAAFYGMRLVFLARFVFFVCDQNIVCFNFLVNSIPRCYVHSVSTRNQMKP